MRKIQGIIVGYAKMVHVMHMWPGHGGKRWDLSKHFMEHKSLF